VVPVRNLIDYLEHGSSLDEFLTEFPSVTRDQAHLMSPSASRMNLGREVRMSKRDGMVLTMLDVFTLCVRECAVQMMQNAIYVQKELPNVRMSDALRRQAGKICDQLIGTKHDLITELFDLDELLPTDAPNATIGERVERMVRWARDDLLRLHELVVAIEDEGRRDPRALIAGILVTESAGNVLNAFNRMQSAADGVLRAVPGCPLAGSSR
jgi:hypothetical protein